MYNKLLRKILINKKYIFFKSLCLRKKERIHVEYILFMMLMIFCSLLSVV